MPIDPRIALGLDVPDIAGAISGGLKFHDQREAQKYDIARKKAADTREDQLRTALGDILTGNGSFGPSPPQSGGVPYGDLMHDDRLPSGGMSMQDSPEARAARADPEAYLKFQGAQTQITGAQLKAHRDLLETEMQLLGGVYDQASYDRAKTAAKVLHQRFGGDTSVIDQLPPEYSPEVVRSLQMQGMETKDQLHQIAFENKLDWDMYDDQQDNARADTLAGSTIEDRNSRRGIARERVQIARERASGRGPAGGPKTENAVYSDIMQRWTHGGQINPREREFMRTYELRHGGKRPAGRGRGGVSAGNGAIIVNPKTKKRMKLQGGQWVPID